MKFYNQVQGSLRVIAILLPLAISAIGARADQVGDMLSSITTKLSPMIVTVNAVNTAHLPNGDRDFRAELKGVVVSSDGLIMTTNAYFSGERFREALGGGEDQQSGAADIKIEPKEIRITVGNESTEYYGTIAAQDSSLGLAFIQIRDLNGRALPFVDLAAAAQTPTNPNIGELTGSVTRLSKYYDFAPVAVEDRVAGILSKPRKAYIPEGYAGGLGLPVYTAEGVIGIVTDIEQRDESAEDKDAQALSRLFDDELADFHSQFIVPVSTIAPLVSIAKTRAAASTLR